MENFELEKVKKLVAQNSILRGAFERTTRKSNRGEASYKALFNALIKNDKGFMEQYSRITT
jgi:hypothetical protein